MVKADIAERSLEYAVQIVQFCRSVRKDTTSQVLIRQLVRAGTSVGANVHEAQGAQSKADFIAKMSVAYKEARESAYWIRVILRTELVTMPQVSELLDETQQLIKILGAILLTSKASAPRRYTLHS